MKFSQLPVISYFSELDPPSRKFLAFTTINIFGWQCIIGEVLVLFGREIDMPASWVGVLMSLLPFSQALVVFTVPLVERYGPRRILTTVWVARHTVVLSVFSMPWAIAHWGPQAGWYVLVFSTAGFCFARALGIGGWFPWVHEIVPASRRGLYFSSEQSLVQAITVIVALATAQVLKWAGQPRGFYFLYAFGITVGFASIALMRKIPGGRATPDFARKRRRSWVVHRAALHDRDFMRYVGVAFLGVFSWGMFLATYILYMKDALGYSSPRVLLLKGIGSLGAIFALRHWGRYADRWGSGPALSHTAAGHAIVALAWVGLVPGWEGADWLIVPLIALSIIFLPASGAITVRGMMARLAKDSRVGYTNVYICATALGSGSAMVLAGQVIERFDLAGFRGCFLASSVFSLATAYLIRHQPQEPGKPRLRTPRNLLNPVTPLRSLGRTVWVTLGLEERKEKRREQE